MERIMEALPAKVFQCRISVMGVFLKHGKKKYREESPRNFDSTVVFPAKEFAEAYMELYEKDLLELGFITPKDKTTKKVIELVTYVPNLPKNP
jgi:hypothetical protein